MFLRGLQGAAVLLKGASGRYAEAAVGECFYWARFALLPSPVSVFSLVLESSTTCSTIYCNYFPVVGFVYISNHLLLLALRRRVVPCTLKEP